MSDIGVLVSLDDQSIEQSKVVLDYTSRDFTAIRSQLIGLAKGLMPKWNTAGESPDFGTLILELFAYMGDVMHFYIDRTASEAFLGTAVRRQSILYIADMMGYTPIGQQAASVILQFGLDANATEDVVIPKGSRVYNQASQADGMIIFETMADVSLTPGVTGVEVFATEGIMVNDESTGKSIGSPNTEVVLKNKGVVYNTITVVTREGHQVITWDYVTHLANARPTQAVFTTFMDEQGLTHIIFGDNAAGRIPPVNAEIFANYRYGQGAEANDLPPNSLNVLASVTNVDTWGVTVGHAESPVGGTDPEGIDSMRYSISRGGSRIRNRAVTLNDYADLAMQVPGVAKSVAHGTVYTAVHVKVAPVEGKATDESMDLLCDQVEDYLSDKVMIGSTVYAEPRTANGGVNALWQNVYIRMTVHVQDAYNRTTVRKQVDTVLRQVLSFDAVDFGTRVTIGQIYRSALAVQGVEWAELEYLNTVTPPDESPLAENTINIETDELLIPPIFPPLPEITATVTNKVLTSNVATLTTSSNHGFGVGMVIQVAGVDSVFNGTYTVTAIAPTTVSYAKTNANVATTAATGTISRVDPAAPESDVDFPDMSEEERTHDGLWVKAVGGLVGT